MGITGIIYAVIIASALGGAGLWLHGYGSRKFDEGKAECAAAVAAANDKANKAATALADETQKHIEDMTTAYQQGEKEASARVVYVTKKGASDVAAHPEVFGNAACTLPADALRNLNAARAGLRRDPPADSLRVDVRPDASASARPPADSSGAPASVRGTSAAATGDARGNVPADAAGRRPMGKVRP